jgi:hypothetical protein
MDEVPEDMEERAVSLLDPVDAEAGDDEAVVARLAIDPPSRPVKPIVIRPISRAALSARATAADFPLVEIARARSPFFPRSRSAGEGHRKVVVVRHRRDEADSTASVIAGSGRRFWRTGA